MAYFKDESPKKKDVKNIPPTSANGSYTHEKINQKAVYDQMGGAKNPNGRGLMKKTDANKGL